jgi:hypothetical protein
MPEPLRPMSTGELLDRTFALYKHNFLLFVAIAAPAPAIYLVFNLLSSLGMSGGSVMTGPVGIAGSGARAGFNTAAITAVVIGVVIGVLVYMLGLAITHAATVRAVSAVHLGRKTTAGEAYRELKGRYLRIIGVFIKVAIRVFGGSALLYLVAVLISVGAIAAASTLGTLGTVAGVVVMIAAVISSIILGISLFVRYALAVQACVVEDISAKESLKRSVFLAKGDRNRILTVYTLFVVLQMVVAFTLAFGTQAMAAPFHSVRLSGAFGALAGFIAGVLTSPLATVAMSLVYYDQRVRKEAFDLQLMMAALDGPQTNAVAAP